MPASDNARSLTPEILVVALRCRGEIKARNNTYKHVINRQKILIYDAMNFRMDRSEIRRSAGSYFIRAR